MSKDLRSLNISLMAVFASLYAILVIALAPISFSAIQIRVADALIPLSISYGYPVILGVTFGNIIANLYGGYGTIDVIGGSIANFFASYFAYKLRKHKVIACLAASLIIGLIVGSYLGILLNLPIIFTVTSITLSSLVSISGIGYSLVILIERNHYKLTETTNF